jgi:hypothetical protein
MNTNYYVIYLEIAYIDLYLPVVRSQPGVGHPSEQQVIYIYIYIYIHIQFLHNSYSDENTYIYIYICM